MRSSLLLLALMTTTPLTAHSEPPRAKQVPHTLEIHGRTLSDPFFWLRNRKDPDVLSYLKAENAYCDGQMAHTKALQQQLYREMLSRLQEEDQRPAYRQGQYGYFVQTRKGQAYPIYCRRPWNKKGPVQVLLDLNQLAKGKSYMAVGPMEVSPDGNWLAYGLDETGYRQYVLHFKNLRTGELSTERLQRVTSLAWGLDNKTVYYTTEDEVTKRSDRFFRHTVGQAQSQQLYYEKDELFDVSCASSRDEQMVLLHSVSKTSTECRFLSARPGPPSLQLLRPREKDHEYSADFFEGHFYVRTNRQAPLFKLVRSSLQQPGQWADWFVPAQGEQIDDVCLFPGGRSALMLRRQGTPCLALRDAQGELREVEFPETVRSLYLGANAHPDHPSVRVQYESPVTPPSTYDVELTSGQARLVKRQPVPNYQSDRYQCQRLLVKARDGVEVPVTLLYRRELQPDGSHPCLLEAYGSYGAVTDPEFSANLFSLVDRGVVYAYAHIRGGGELGEPWRQAGRMMQKMNTFNDFVDCGQHLVDSGWSKKDGLVCLGGSAGGLLVGAASNQRPELFRAVVSQVPFVDVINTMLDETLPLTTSEFVEWGNPKEKAAFDYMVQYSPYDNLRAAAYPAMLVKVSLNDSQVPYWEGAKYVARLRSLKTDDRPVLLKTNLAAGHGGSSSRYERLKERAFEYAFMLWQMGR